VGVVIQASYKGGECKFYFSREKIVYFNIRGKGSVFQASLRGGKCNLLYNESMKNYLKCFFFLGLVARAHTIKCGEVGCPGFELDPYINYTMSLPIELSSRDT